MPPRPQHLNAGNAGPFTLDGTRSYRVGRRQAVIIDPGPDVDSHVRALVDSVRDAEMVRVLVTHRHADHAGAVGALSQALGAEGLAGDDGRAAVLGPEEVDGVMPGT